MSKRIRVVVISYGSMGKLYADMIFQQRCSGLVLAGICCRNKEGQLQIAAAYPGVQVYETAQSLFARADEFDAILIASPHKTHVEYIEQAFLHGIHVLCEKPLAVSLSEAQRLRESRKKETAFGVIFNWRARPVWQTVKQLVNSGCLGEITSIVWIANFWYRAPFYHRMSPWRSTWNGEGGGLLINQMQHILDLWQWLFGMPDSILSWVDFGRFNPIAVDDSAQMMLQYRSGIRGTCVTASGESPGSNHLEIHAANGKVIVEDGRVFWDKNEVSTQDFAQRKDGVYTGIPHALQELPVSEQAQEHEEYVRILSNFGNHLLRGEALIAPGFEACAALEIVNAAYLSAAQGGLVSIPIAPEAYDAWRRHMEQKEAAQKQ